MTNDDELECNIQTELQFFLSTMEIFGLPKDYINGNGHHKDWDKQKDADKGLRGKKGKKAKKVTALSKKLAAAGIGRKEED